MGRPIGPRKGIAAYHSQQGPTGPFSKHLPPRLPCEVGTPPHPTGSSNLKFRPIPGGTALNSTIKLVVYTSIAAVWICCLSAQDLSRGERHNKKWPSKSAPRATWERVKPNGPRPEVPSNFKSPYVYRTSFNIRGKFKGQAFTLRYLNPAPGTFDSGALVLSVGGRDQIFTKIDPDWQLEWAGDADGDGKLDLIIGSTGEGGGSKSDLYLSTLSKDGGLLGYSATLAFEEGC